MRLKAALLSLLLLGALAAPAQASLNLCNRTSYILYAATAAINGGKAPDARLDPHRARDCQTAQAGADRRRPTCVYAPVPGSAIPGRSAPGAAQFPICVQGRRLRFAPQKTLGADCVADDQFSLPFAALDTKGMPNWSMTFDENPAYAVADRGPACRRQAAAGR